MKKLNCLLNLLIKHLHMKNKNSEEMNYFAINGYNYFLSNFERKIIYDKLDHNLNILYAE